MFEVTDQVQEQMYSKNGNLSRFLFKTGLLFSFGIPPFSINKTKFLAFSSIKEMISEYEEIPKNSVHIIVDVRYRTIDSINKESNKEIPNSNGFFLKDKSGKDSIYSIEAKFYQTIIHRNLQTEFCDYEIISQLMGKITKINNGYKFFVFHYNPRFKEGETSRESKFEFGFT
ncbi:hypothetical protein ACFL1H_03195 [Nanoarchaeota archaeon]